MCTSKVYAKVVKVAISSCALSEVHTQVWRCSLVAGCGSLMTKISSSQGFDGSDKMTDVCHQELKSYVPSQLYIRRMIYVAILLQFGRCQYLGVIDFGMWPYISAIYLCGEHTNVVNGYVILLL